MCWLFFHLPFGYEAVAGFFMKVAKWSSLAVFAVLAIFFVLSVFVPSVLPLRSERVKLNLVSVT